MDKKEQLYKLYACIFFNAFMDFDRLQSYETVNSFFYVDFEVTQCLSHDLLPTT